MISYGLGVFLKLFLINQFLKQSYQSHIQKNVEEYYDPFHKSLLKQLEFLLKKFGFCYHFDLHTMPSKALKHFKIKPDIVLGNNFGKSSSENLIYNIKTVLRNLVLRLKSTTIRRWLYN